MTNPYKGNPAYGKHLSDLMCRINTLAFGKEELNYSSITSWATGAIAGLAVDSTENVYVLNGDDRKIYKYTNTGTPITNWTVFSGYGGIVRGLAIDGADNVFAGCAGSGIGEIEKYTGAGALVTHWGLPTEAQWLCLSASDGRLYAGHYSFAPSTWYGVRVYDAAGALQRTITLSGVPWCISALSDTNVYIGIPTGVVVDRNGIQSPFETENVPWAIVLLENEAVLTFETGTPPAFRVYLGPAYHSDVNVYDLAAGDVCNVMARFGDRAYVGLYDASTFTFSVQKVQIQEQVCPGIEFYAHSPATKASIGYYPGDNALCTVPMVTRNLTQMRDAIETVVAAGYYLNPATSNAYNLTPASADNLYYVAMGDRTKYGATGGPRATWTRTDAQMKDTPLYDIDIGEIYECVVTLEAADTP